MRNLSFAALFGVFSYLQPIAYRKGYPTLAERVGFAHSFGTNTAVRLFYGEPRDLLTVAGYTAWRVGGTLAILAAVFGLLAAVRALRSEEDSGRMEVVLASVVGRRPAFVASVTAIGTAYALLWLAEVLGLIAGGLPVGGAAFLGLATVSVIPVCAALAAVACQLASTRRGALELGGGVVALLFLARVVADTAHGLSWLRWATPLGWAEELRPFTGQRPLVLLLPAAASLLLFSLAGSIAIRRDVGTGLLATHDSTEANFGLLSSPAAHALREEHTSLIAWSLGIAAYGVIVGVLAKTSSSAGISKQLSHEVGRLGSGSIITPTGYVGFTFIFFVLATSLFACAQISAVRREEAGGQVETLFALPISRHRWLAGRLAVAIAATVVLALLAGAATWVGATAGGVAIAPYKLVEAGANCLPVALLFLGIGALAYAALPRASVGISYGVVIVGFLWNLIAALLGAPGWLVKLSPFAHVALVPAESFRTISAALMIGLAALCGAAAVAAFGRRDVIVS